MVRFTSWGGTSLGSGSKVRAWIMDLLFVRPRLRRARAQLVKKSSELFSGLEATNSEKPFSKKQEEPVVSPYVSAQNRLNGKLVRARAQARWARALVRLDKFKLVPPLYYFEFVYNIYHNSCSFLHPSILKIVSFLPLLSHTLLFNLSIAS